MNNRMNQEDKLDYLIDIFKEDSVEYKDIQVPNQIDEKKRILRSLMNIRMPKEISKDVLDIQDEYLKERVNEIGIVTLDDIPIKKGILSIWQGDITRLKVDAIVNAANSKMLGCFVPMHNCIDNCIHNYAGIQLRNECNQKMNAYRKIYGKNYEQPTSIPMLTDAYNLPSRKVIHVVGPIVQNKLTLKLEEDLANCYKNSLDLCKENNLKSIAFCCISTGVFNFPNRKAAEIAVSTVNDWLKVNNGCMDRIVFNVFKDGDKKYYEELI